MDYNVQKTFKRRIKLVCMLRDKYNLHNFNEK